MQAIYQKTLSKPISFVGIGLHSGKTSKVVIHPGKADQGIIFERVDLNENNLIEANYSNVSSAKLCTTLENSFGARVSTVEHLLAALYIAGIDNAKVEVDNEEIPIMDGSAKNFLDILKKTEINILDEKRKYLKILNKVELIDGTRRIAIEPSKSFEVDFQLNYKNKIIGKQKNIVNFNTDNIKEIVESRTFCLFEDIEKIKKSGLAKGGSLDNAIVVDQDKVLNKDGLRNEKEFVNHKILDLAGDFLLSGYRVLGKVTCYQGGHELTNTFLRKLVKTKESISIVKLDNPVVIKKESINPSLKIAVNA
jgi:UDP-3-O-[3-hydroxymyristoyl] N-acetylglucosamine deacetylase